MTEKELVLDTIKELPDSISMDAIVERLNFLAAVQRGIDELDAGEGIPHAEVRRQLATWLTH